MRSWQLQEAKAKLSQLVRDAAEEPQQISVHGKPVAVVVSQERYEDLTTEKPSFVRFVRDSPLYGENLAIDRDKSPIRRIDL